MNAEYDHQFFENMDRSASFAAELVAPIVTEAVHPISVLDVGCGTGYWLNAFGRVGASDIMGIDADWMPSDCMAIPSSSFRRVDLSQPFSLGRRFDLVVCLEVAEHLDESVADSFVDSLVAHGDVVLFSAAAPYQGGVHHVNEQWLTYWIEKMARHDCVGVDFLRRKIWDKLTANGTWWYAQNMILFVKRSRLSDYPILARARELQEGEPIAFAHPKLLERHVPLEDRVSLRLVAKCLPRMILRSIRGRLSRLMPKRSKA